MSTKENKWFLIKKEWAEALEDLTVEQRGLILSKLYGMDVELPGMLNALWKVLNSEFTTVNDFNNKKQEERSEQSSKAAKVRWKDKKDTSASTKEAPALYGNAPAMRQHKEEMLQHKTAMPKDAFKVKESKVKEIKESKLSKSKVKETNKAKDDPGRIPVDLNYMQELFK